MDIQEIEQLVQIIRDADISELTISAGSPRSTVKLRKTLSPRVRVKPAAPVHMPAVRTPAGEDAPADTSVYITAPMVGIFHAVDGFASPETMVKAGQVVGSIESMKLFNDISSEYEGVVTEVLVDDGMPVEYGQNLIRLETA